MNELIIQVIFYVFALLAVGSAVMVITQNNPVRCVLFLVVTFFASAGLWLIAGAEFLSLILILVYVGAVMTLFLFVVMMINIDSASLKQHFIRYLPIGLILVALLVSLLMASIPEGAFQANTIRLQEANNVSDSQLLVEQATNSASISNTAALGAVLYTDYLLAFEVAAVLLLVAIVSAITLAHRGTARSKRQDIVKQIMTRAEDRVQLVNVKSEK